MGENSNYNLVDEWQEFVSGNLSSLAVIFEGSYKEMFGYGLNLCSQPEIVEDSIQDLFQLIWERRKNLNHVYSPKVYLFVSLRRKILKRQNKGESLKTNCDLEEINNRYVVKKGIEHLIIKKESARKKKKALNNAMNQLSNRQKRVVQLYYYSGMDFREIKKILSVNKQSVYNYLYRAKETLKTMV